MSHRLRTMLVGAIAAVTCILGLAAPAAHAESPGAMARGVYVCSGGTSDSPTLIPSGTYARITVDGLCSVAAGSTVTVRGDVTVHRGGVFDTVTQSTVHIWGNAVAVDGGLLAIGCMEDTDCATQADQRVGGNVIGSNALSVYLHGVTVGGNVMINGGGPGTNCGLTSDPYAALLTTGDNLPIKDNIIGGDVHINGWQGCWMGLIRNQIGGSAFVQRNVATMAATNLQGPDSTEIIANMIGGSLTCRNNLPAAQFGDGVEGAPPGYGPNLVGGAKRGECHNL